MLLRDRVVLFVLIVTGPNALGAWLWSRFGVEIAATVILFLASGLGSIVAADIWLTAKERKLEKQRKRQQQQIKFIEGA